MTRRCESRLTAISDSPREKIAESAGATARCPSRAMYDTTVNDEALTARMLPVLERAADGQVAQAPLAGASEDFSFFAKETPGLYVFLGVTPRDQDPAEAAPNHNPDFFVDERALVVGTRMMASLAVNFLERRAGVGVYADVRATRGVTTRSVRSA